MRLCPEPTEVFLLLIVGQGQLAVSVGAAPSACLALNASNNSSSWDCPIVQSSGSWMVAGTADETPTTPELGKSSALSRRFGISGSVAVRGMLVACTNGLSSSESLSTWVGPSKTSTELESKLANDFCDRNLMRRRLHAGPGCDASPTRTPL